MNTPYNPFVILTYPPPSGLRLRVAVISGPQNDVKIITIVAVRPLYLCMNLLKDLKLLPKSNRHVVVHSECPMSKEMGRVQRTIGVELDSISNQAAWHENSTM